LKGKQVEKDDVLFRSSAGIMTSFIDDHMNGREINRQKDEQELKFKGWRVPLDKPYTSVGEYADVVSALKRVKSSVPHCKKLRKKTNK